ncbi:MAG: hypothetical protein WCF04_03615, partial [Candidatus Nanopelagicales bacterium]
GLSADVLDRGAWRLAWLPPALTGRTYGDPPITPPLQFRMYGDRVAGMPALALLYPSLVLVRAGDPLQVARTIGGPVPTNRDALLGTVRARIRQFLAALPEGAPSERPDQPWYWAAPFLLDRVLASEDHEPLCTHMAGWDTRDEEDQESRLGAHLKAADDVPDSSSALALPTWSTC